MKKINISKEELDNAVKKFNTKEEIADFFGISTPTMSRILKDNNMEIKKTSSYLCKKIGQYDDNWNLIAIYENILETEKKFSKSILLKLVCQRIRLL